MFSFAHSGRWNYWKYKFHRFEVHMPCRSAINLDSINFDFSLYIQILNWRGNRDLHCINREDIETDEKNEIWRISIANMFVLVSVERSVRRKIPPRNTENSVWIMENFFLSWTKFSLFRRIDRLREGKN